MSSKVVIIAEIGINHDGSFELAKLLVRQAIDSGCDQIKFQYRRPSESKMQLELGSEIIQSEISRIYITPLEIMTLAEIVKSSGKEVGISFFSLSDAHDFSEYLDYFDFFKIPSASNQNEKLVDYLLTQNKPIYLSLGMLEHFEVLRLASLYSQSLNVVPFHCVSNYPTKAFNSNLKFICTLQEIWKRPVGYSSHDDNLLVLAKAIDNGAMYIERHIAIDRHEKGLDKSSSSTAEEFRMLREYVDSYELLQRPILARTINQGERLNRQNLGYSLYSLRDFETGEQVSLDELIERSPSVGLTITDFKSLSSRILKSPLKISEPVSKFHFEEIRNLDLAQQTIARRKLISVPVRFRDLNIAEQVLGLNSYEFHMSYQDMKLEVAIRDFINPNFLYSVHAPDYISSTQILDIHSDDNLVAEESQEIIDQCFSLALQIADLTGNITPVIASINTSSVVPNFYETLKELQVRAEDQKINFLPQFLPPIAWYFGGSVPLQFMNSPEAIAKISELDIKICLDLSHLILSCNFFDLNLTETFKVLTPYCRHFHLAGGEGIDSEGTSLKDGTPEQKQILQEIVDSNYLKVLEVWQGHLNRFAGFIPEIEYISRLSSSQS